MIKEDRVELLKIPEEKRSRVRVGWSRRRKLLLVFALILSLAAVFGVRRLFQPPRVVAARATVVQEGLPEVLLSAGGYIVADSTILVSSEINGQIKSVLVQEGDAVQKGDVLAEIVDDDYRAKLDLAEAEYRHARSFELMQSKLYHGGVIAKIEYDEAQRLLAVRKASYDSARYFFENTKIRSPIAGTVIQREKEPGEFLLPGITSEGVPGSAVIKIADLRLINVELDILESEVGKLALQQPAIVFPDGLPGKSYAAKLFYIAPQADRQKSVIPVKVRITAPDAQLKPEMSARVSFLRSEPTQAVVRRIQVPSSALFQREGKAYVFVVEQDKLKLTLVALHTQNAQNALLDAGLKGDEAVALEANPKWEDGLRVEVRSGEGS